MSFAIYNQYLNRIIRICSKIRLVRWWKVLMGAQKQYFINLPQDENEVPKSHKKYKDIGLNKNKGRIIAKVIYPLFIKWALLHKRRIDYLSIYLFRKNQSFWQLRRFKARKKNIDVNCAAISNHFKKLAVTFCFIFFPLLEYEYLSNAFFQWS